jgi:cytochrome c-type biogenesis protein CcmH/NrfG
MILLVVALVGTGVARQWRQRRAANAGGATARDSVTVALYERGQRGYDSRRPAGTVDAIDAFNAAVRRDSTYTPAWTGLAKAYIRSYERAFVIPGVPPDSALRLAVGASERALALEHDNADALLAQAIVTRHIDPTDRTLALRSARRAIARDSTNAVAWHFLALDLMEVGDFDGAMRAWRRCVAVDPTYTQGLTFLALGHMWRRSHDSATVWADSAIALDPNYFFGWMSLGENEVEAGDWKRAAAAYAAATRIGTDVERANAIAGSALVEARAGHVARARTLIRQADSLGATYSPVPLHTAVYQAHTYAALGDADRAMHWLESFDNAGDLHFQLHLRCDPSFDPIAGDRRFRALLLRERPPPARGCR